LFIAYRMTLLFVCVGFYSSVAVADENRWWPVQKLPASVVRTRERGFPNPQEVLACSVSGLAAKAVNQGTGDEMVWMSSGNVDYEAWYEAWVKKNPSVKVHGEFKLWELVDRYSGRGLIKGYVLYTQDKSAGQINDHRKGMNQSVNIATSLAGLLDGIVVEENLEDEVRKHGLTLLMDARDKTLKWCFETYQDRFNKNLLCAQDPKKANLRDLAIAQQAFVLFGNDEPLDSALKWLEPLSPIAGWNGGDEFQTTRLSSLYGHIQTATDWCINAPVLMSGSDQIIDPPRQRDFDPKGIKFDDRLTCVSFVITDGDNVQWYESSFFHGNPSYWANPDRGKIPFGWSSCFSHLTQLCPVAVEYALDTQKENDRMIEWGGGYYYPDLFGHSRPNRNELLAQHARRTWTLMRRTGTRIIGFNVAKVDTPDALQAYQTFAKETDDLLAIFAFQYAPYEGGAGKTFWVKDGRGVEIPVVTARYSIWEHSNRRERSGTPAKVAREIVKGASGKVARNDWVVVHAWSYFRKAPDNDENAEDMEQGRAETQGGVRGYTPATWCAERLPNSVKVVSPEELVWRIRMKRDATTTRKLIEEFQPR